MAAFDTEMVIAGLTGSRLRGPVHFVASTGSTNDDLRELAVAGAGEGTVVVAGAQFAGRGRQGRAWHGEPGQSLLFSVLLRPPLPVAHWGSLGPLAGMAAAAACRTLARVAVGTKWPNDVVFGGRKLGGVLLEARAPQFVVVGIGLNVAGEGTALPKPLQATAATLEAISGLRSSPEQLLTETLNQLDRLYELLLSRQSETLSAQQRQLETTLGKTVVVRLGEQTLEGRAVDVTAHGELVLRTLSGEVVVSSGEVQSLRGRNGELPG